MSARNRLTRAILLSALLLTLPSVPSPATAVEQEGGEGDWRWIDPAALHSEVVETGGLDVETGDGVLRLDAVPHDPRASDAVTMVDGEVVEDAESGLYLVSGDGAEGVLLSLPGAFALDVQGPELGHLTFEMQMPPVEDEAGRFLALFAIGPSLPTPGCGALCPVEGCDPGSEVVAPTASSADCEVPSPCQREPCDPCDLSHLLAAQTASGLSGVSQASSLDCIPTPCDLTPCPLDVCDLLGPYVLSSASSPVSVTPVPECIPDPCDLRGDPCCNEPVLSCVCGALEHLGPVASPSSASIPTPDCIPTPCDLPGDPCCVFTSASCIVCDLLGCPIDPCGGITFTSTSSPSMAPIPAVDSCRDLVCGWLSQATSPPLVDDQCNPPPPPPVGPVSPPTPPNPTPGARGVLLDADGAFVSRYGPAWASWQNYLFATTQHVFDWQEDITLTIAGNHHWTSSTGPTASNGCTDDSTAVWESLRSHWQATSSPARDFVVFFTERTLYANPYPGAVAVNGCTRGPALQDTYDYGYAVVETRGWGNVPIKALTLHETGHLFAAEHEYVEGISVSCPHGGNWMTVMSASQDPRCLFAQFSDDGRGASQRAVDDLIYVANFGAARDTRLDYNEFRVRKCAEYPSLCNQLDNYYFFDEPVGPQPV